MRMDRDNAKGDRGANQQQVYCTLFRTGLKRVRARLIARYCVGTNWHRHVLRNIIEIIRFGGVLTDNAVLMWAI